MHRKISVVSINLIGVVAFATAFVFPVQCVMSAQEQRLTVKRTLPTDPPLAILQAMRSAEEVIIEVQNQSAHPIEYFEIEIGRGRVFAGRDTLIERWQKHPKWEEIPKLHLTSQEIRTFRFPLKTEADTVVINIVLLSNGQGWLQGAWLRKLEKADKTGRLWKVDQEETRARTHGRISKARPQPSKKGSSFLPEKKQQICYLIADYLFWDYDNNMPGDPGPSVCGFYYLSYVQAPSMHPGNYVDFCSHANCYLFGETQSCDTDCRPINTGSCSGT